MADRRMRRFFGSATSGAAAAVLLFAVPSLVRPEVPAVQTILIPGVALELSFRALQPGEVILVKRREDPSVRRIDLRLRTQTRRVEFDGKSRTVLLGIDVAARPQSYFMEITTERRDGSKENVFRKLTVGPKEFPETNLTVAPGMAKAPPEEAERIKREAALVASVLGAVSPEWLGEGPFVSPLPEGEPFPNFGQRRLYNNEVASTHMGVDISAPEGTPVRADNAGRVVLASDLYYSGMTIIIDHGLGVFTFYGHFSKILVKRGDLVKKGDLIAEVGHTGRSTGPHLHWSVRILDSRVDPFSLAALPLE
ncbi:MAG: M23 family metallopeptidase [Candidatus Aminicenantes bacterium]|nr:M23 family metallopeptidase [Candidatus Aminicenantes bacterium]